ARFLKPVQYVKWQMNKIDVARETYKVCSEQVERRPEMLEVYKLPDNFQTWFAMAVLHIWMVNCRLRAEGLDGKDIKQELFDAFSLDVELKIHKAGVKANIGAIMTDLLSSYYGQTLAYDEGLYYGDAVMAGALWRNLFASKKVDPTILEAVLVYVREQLRAVDAADRSDILNGKFQFADVKVQ
ncbi:ubiquinol-cytochrome C chaperone-domain-containing protein, partial [Blyttiomyces helicus]